jgi:hypothetical protein
MKFNRVLLLVIIAEMLIGFYAWLTYGLTLEGLQAVTRFSGRLSLLLFSIIFIVHPQTERLSKILSGKPYHVFATAHGIHLVELLSFVYLSKSELIPIRLAGGFLAYAMIFSLPVIQQYYEAERISAQKFRIAQTAYLYYVWFIFFMSYLPRVQGKLPNVGGNYWEFVVLLGWVCIMLGTKLTSLLIGSKRTSD